MTIDEYLNSIGFVNGLDPFHQIAISSQLIAAIDNDPSMALFSYLMKTVLNGYGKSETFLINREKFIEFCNSIGINTIEDLQIFCKNIDGPKIVDAIDPEIHIPKNYSRSIGEIMVLLKNQCHVETDCKYLFGDAYYWLINKDNLDIILSKSPIDKFKYIINSHDCEDFSRELRAWISSRYLGDRTFGRIEVNQYKSNQRISIHSLCIAIIDNFQIVYVEPQTDQIYNPKEIIYNIGIDLQKIRLVEF